MAQCTTGCDCLTPHYWVGKRLVCVECEKAAAREQAHADGDIERPDYPWGPAPL